jgi:uncharacterized membrane protein YbhN (UPF0104 family)
MSGTGDQGTGAPGDSGTTVEAGSTADPIAPPDTAGSAPSGVAGTKPPSRRDAILRVGIVVAVMVVIFGIILPKYIDYQDVIETLQGLTIQQFLIVGVFGLIAWFLTGAIFAELIPGLGFIRGTQAYLILTGIGASIPLGPWNMAVLWVVIRGWGLPLQTTTGGILLYGIFDQLSRFGLMAVAGVFLFISEGLNSGVSVEAGLISTFMVIGLGLFILLGGGLVLVVRSERLARKIGQITERVVGAVLRRLGRKVPDIEGSLVRFRVTLGDTVRQRGIASFIAAMLSKFAWALLMIVSMRVVGVTQEVLPASIIFAGVAAVFVITILPISPGGAGVPDLLYISIYTTYTGGADSSAISAAVMLFRAFQWALPIPISWILLSRSRRGKSLLPTKAEFSGSEPIPNVAPVSG